MERQLWSSSPGTGGRVGTASTNNSTIHQEDILAWRVIFDSRAIVPIAKNNDHDIWWFTSFSYLLLCFQIAGLVALNRGMHQDSANVVHVRWHSLYTPPAGWWAGRRAQPAPAASPPQPSCFHPNGSCPPRWQEGRGPAEIKKKRRQHANVSTVYHCIPLKDYLTEKAMP